MTIWPFKYLVAINLVVITNKNQIIFPTADLENTSSKYKKQYITSEQSDDFSALFQNN